MANLILASKREVKSGSQMWHVYRLSENTKSDEFFFAQPIKALRYAFLLRKRSGAIMPKAIYTKLMADVEASKAQAEQAAQQESAAPEAEQAAEQSALAKAFEQMKAKHPDAVLLFRVGDEYRTFGEDCAVLQEICKADRFAAAALDKWLPVIVRKGKRVAICDEPSESAPKKKATRKRSTKSESK